MPNRRLRNSFKNIHNRFRNIFQSTIGKDGRIVKSRKWFENKLHNLNIDFDQLPDDNIYRNMTDDEFLRWRDQLILDIYKKHPNYGIYYLKPYLLTPNLCTELAKLVQLDGSKESDISSFLEYVPEK